MFEKFGIPSSFTADAALMQQLIVLLPIAAIALIVFGYKLIVKPFADRHEVEDTLIDLESRIISSTVMRRTQLMNEEAESALFAPDEDAPQPGLEGFDPAHSIAPPRVGLQVVTAPLPPYPQCETDVLAEQSEEDHRADHMLEPIDPIVEYSTDEIDDDLAHIDTPESCGISHDPIGDVWPDDSTAISTRRDFRDAR